MMLPSPFPLLPSSCPALCAPIPPTTTPDAKNTCTPLSELPTSSSACMSVCNRRLRGASAEDEGRGEATRVSADGDPADLYPRGVQAGARLFARTAQHPAVCVHGEPAYCVRY